VPKDEDLQFLRATRPSQQPHQGEQVPGNRYTNDQSNSPPSITTGAPNLAELVARESAADEFANPTRPGQLYFLVGVGYSVAAETDAEQRSKAVETTLVPRVTENENLQLLVRSRRPRSTTSSSKRQKAR